LKIQDLTDERCPQAIPGFLHSTNLERMVVAEVAAEKEIQQTAAEEEWELREREAA
jgi:hypothetical protein